MIRINPLVQTDSYKISMPPMYPDNMNHMFDNIMARKGGIHSYAIFFGMQFYIKDILTTPFTQEDVDEAEVFYKRHFLGDVFVKEQFQYILDEYNGYFPVKIRSVKEGTKVPEGNVLSTFECSDPKCASIVTFLETMAISYLWYGTTVCTNSYAMKQIIKKYYERTSDIEDTSFALHDFGARGVIPGGQKIGGAAHLMNSLGSDNLEAVYAIDKYFGWNSDDSIGGYSIPATEHSVMSSEGRYGEMIVAQRVFDRYAKDGSIIAMVNDTYDMEQHIKDFSKIFKEKYKDIGVRWVTRPDSGYPPSVVVNCLEILFEEFGGTFNSKNMIVLDPCVRLIQGDGIDEVMIKKVLKAVQEAGFSAENVAFGSGGGLLQKVNRDDLRFAMKASYIEVQGEGRDIYKDPKTQDGDYSKKSKGGILGLYKLGNGQYVSLTTEQYDDLKDLDDYPIEDALNTVYDGTLKGQTPYTKFYKFDEIKVQ